MSRVRTIASVLPAVALIVAFGLVWEIAVRVMQVNAVILPAPSAIWVSLIDNFGLLMGDLAVTFQEFILGFLLGLSAAMVIGIAIVYSRTLERVLYPLVVASQAVPVFAFAPLLVIWFGFGILPKVLMVTVLVFFPICVNQVEGLRSADPRTIDMMRAFGANEIRIFRSIRMPSSVPFLVAGVQMGITFAMVGAVVAEWLGASQGLGYRMVVAHATSKTALVFAAVLVTATVSVLLFVLVRVVANRLFPWARTDRRRG